MVLQLQDRIVIVTGGRRRYRWGDAKYMTGQTLMADGGANKLY